MIAGELGTVVNAGNRDETGSFWTLAVRALPQDQDAAQINVAPAGPLAGLVNGPLASLLHGSAAARLRRRAAVQHARNHRLGTYVINQMIKDHFLIQLDHMDSATATSALAIATAHHYSGVISAHCCSSPQLFQGIYDDGRVHQPAGRARACVRRDLAGRQGAERSQVPLRLRLGLGHERPGRPARAVVRDSDHLPVPSYDGKVTFTQEQWGDRTFDLNTDGLANYGMYADWLRDLQLVGGNQMMADMFQGAEAYLETWERADGVPATSCLPARARFSASGLGRRAAPRRHR